MDLLLAKVSKITSASLTNSTNVEQGYRHTGKENSGRADFILPENSFCCQDFKMTIILLMFHFEGLGAWSPGKFLKF